MKTVIIGIHGLGNKPPKDILEMWWKSAIIEGLVAKNLLADIPQFEMVYWADLIYDKPLDVSETNPESPYFIEEKYEKASPDFLPQNHETRQKWIDFLGRQMNSIFLNEDYSLNYSFISDTIVRNYFKDLDAYYSEPINEEKRLKIKIRERLYQTLYKHRKKRIMLIGHSMGSIIAFDVLTFCQPIIYVHTFITIGSSLGFPNVISKIAAEQRELYKKIENITTPPGVKKQWFNFSDIMDNVAFNYKLSDDFSENEYEVKPVDFLVTNNYQANNEPNPHKSFGYLRTPQFTGVLHDFIKEAKPDLLQQNIIKFLAWAGLRKKPKNINWDANNWA